MKKKYLLIYILSLFTILFTSCDSEAEYGKKFLGKVYEGISTKDLYSDSNKKINLKLSFSELGTARFKSRKYKYYDCIITDKMYPELKPMIVNAMSVYTEDCTEEEIESFAHRTFEGLKKSDCFILSTKNLESIHVDIDKEIFNFTGYIGIGWKDEENYMIILLSTRDLKKGYIFGE